MRRFTHLDPPHPDTCEYFSNLVFHSKKKITFNLGPSAPSSILPILGMHSTLASSSNPWKLYLFLHSNQTQPRLLSQLSDDITRDPNMKGINNLQR